DNYSYSIEVLADYFDDYNGKKAGEIAKEFIQAVVSQPIDKISDIYDNLTYQDKLNSYEVSETYENKISFLSSQLSLLQTGYATLSAKYPTYTIDGKTLNDYLGDIDLYFSNKPLNLLSADLKKNGYVYNVEFADAYYGNRIDDLQREYEYNEMEIEYQQSEASKLQGGSEDLLNAYHTRISELVTKQREILDKIDSYERYRGNAKNGDVYEAMAIDGAKKTAFDKALQERFDKLLEFTNTYEYVSRSLGKSNTKLVYASAGIIETDGNIGTIVTGILAVFAGIVFGAILALIVGMPKYLKERDGKISNGTATEKTTTEE
ncbi:MAG: hypothetical protein MJ072_03450, partial [Clostridia bacterium]|nr:hypothetical protein [Clostridia bacterium]